MTRRTAAVLGACVLAVAGFGLLVLLRPGGPTVTRNADDLLQAVAPLFVALPLCLVRASTSTGRPRTFWILLAAAAGAWGAGQLSWCWLEMVRHQPPTSSGLPVVGYLAAVLCIGIAVVLHPGPRPHWSGRARAVIDGLLIVATLLFVSWSDAMQTVGLSHSGTSVAERITALTYPAADIVLLALLVTVFSRGSRNPRDPLLVVGAALVCLFLGDSLSVYIGLSSSYETGNVADVCWFAAFLVLGLAALAPPLEDVGDIEGVVPPTWTEFITFVPLTLALAAAIVQLARGVRFDAVEIVLAVVSIALLMGRGVLFVLENRVLMGRLESTVTELEWLTLHDPLTGLANRVLFDDRLAQVCAAQQRDPHLVAVAYLDLDDFKLVNDTMGHHTGDELLRQVSLRLAANVRRQDTLARLSGDEFALLMLAVDGADQVEEILRRVVAPVGDPFAVGGRELRVGISVGYSISFGATDPKALLRQADDSMYEAKAGGKHQVHGWSDPADDLVGLA